MIDQTEKELLELLGAMCNETIAPQQSERLAELLRTDSEARQFYRDYLDIHVTLVRRARRGVGNVPAFPRLLPDENNIPISAGFPWTTGAISAGVIALAALLMLGYKMGFGPFAGKIAQSNVGGQVVSEEDSVVSSGSSVPASNVCGSEPLYVAQMTNLTSDVTWGKSTTSQEFLLRVRRGDRVVVSSGLVQLDYFSGAQIILHGPCAFVPTGNNSGRLESGELTGQVSEGDFVLTTPTAKVIDLGTEFGVAVGKSSETEVCVFDGEVRVYGGFHGDDEDASLLLSKGMAARVIGAGHVSRAHDVDESRFARELPDYVEVIDSSVISLVDLLSGSTAGNRRLAGVIAPDTGESDRHPWLREDGPGYSVANGYQTTDWHPFVDGVFIPREDGIGTVVNSSSHQVDLPVSTGRTWGPIWSRRRVPGDTSPSPHEDYWGSDSLAGVVERLLKCETGMIGIHSNVGVTFDLKQIQKQVGDLPQVFRTTVSNLDNSKIRRPEWASRHDNLVADLRVFVDGELRSSRVKFGRADGEFEIRVELTEHDRFLTIVCTDANTTQLEEYAPNPDAYDHVVLIDPVLELSRSTLDIH